METFTIPDVPAVDADDKRLTRAENARYGAVAIVLSVSFFLLIHLRDRGAWSWRLALLAAIVGPLAYVVSLTLRNVVRPLKRHRAVAKVLVTPLDFIGSA